MYVINPKFRMGLKWKKGQWEVWM